MTPLRSLLLATAVGLTAATPLAAQQAAQQAATGALSVAPSGRATTQVSLTPPRVQGAPAPTPLVVSIDYGQPHARGRDVAGGLVPYDQVWRTGANTSTTLTTGVDLEIGGARVPRGSYSLYSLLTRDGWKLIINKQTGQWGTQYDAAQDLARVELRQSSLATPAESFVMTLVPNTGQPASGSLALSWGTLHGVVPWQVAR